MFFAKRSLPILFTVIALTLCGCSKSAVDNSGEVKTPVDNPGEAELEPNIYEQLKRYVIFNFEWIDAKNIIIQMCHKESDRDKIPPDQPYVKTFLYNVYTHEQELLYAGGTDISRGTEDIVSVEGKIYVYDETECQVFNGYKFQYLYDFRSEAERKFGGRFSVNISKDGFCTSRTTNGDIIVYPINEIEKYKVVKPATNKTIQSKQSNHEKIKASWYTKPTWTEDGYNIVFMEIDIRTEDVTIWMVSKDGKIQKSFDFSSASNYAVSNLGDHLIGICEPMFAEDEKEIRIYNTNDDIYKSFLFEDPIEGVGFEKNRDSRYF